MRIQNSVYTANWFDIILGGGGNLQAVFAIQASNRELKIKSITTDFHIIVAGKRVPPASSTDIWFELVADFTAPNRSAKSIVLESGDNFNNTGEGYQIFTPGQLIFDSFYIKNSINFLLTINNFGVPNATINFTFIAETEEKNIYQ